MSDFDNIDEAIRYLINRVSSYERVNLGASISAVYDKVSDLNAYIEVRRPIRTWVKHLRASITPI